MTELNIAIASRSRSNLLERVFDALMPKLPESVAVTLVIDGKDDLETLALASTIHDRYSDVFEYKVIEKSGLAIARNTLIDLCQSKYIRFQDDDDVLNVEMVERILKYHQQNPRTALLTNTKISSECSNPFMQYITGIGGQLFGYEKISQGFVGFTSFWGGRISLPVENIGINRFDPRLKFGSEDIDFGLRWTQNGGKIFYDEEIFATQIRSLNLTEMLERAFQQGRSQAYLVENREHIEITNWARHWTESDDTFHLEHMEVELCHFYIEARRLTQLSDEDIVTLFGEWGGLFLDFIWGRAINLAKSIGFESYRRKLDMKLTIPN